MTFRDQHFHNFLHIQWIFFYYSIQCFTLTVKARTPNLSIFAPVLAVEIHLNSWTKIFHVYQEVAAMNDKWRTLSFFLFCLDIKHSQKFSNIYFWFTFKFISTFYSVIIFPSSLLSFFSVDKLLLIFIIFYDISFFLSWITNEFYSFCFIQVWIFLFFSFHKITRAISHEITSTIANGNF